ncbi:MAG: aminodeoxychorismate lyase [Methylophilaceae bacterium]
MSQSQAYLVNGRFEGVLTPFDRGFAYGDGVFRTLVLQHGVPHCWPHHYRKLEEDCNALRIVCPSQETLRGDIVNLVNEADEHGQATIKIIITRGESARGFAVPPLAQPTRIVIKMPLPQYPETNFDVGITLHLCQTRLARQPRLAGVKHLNRLENVLARMEWLDSHITDGLMLDEGGDVIECISGNVFARFGDQLTTPDLSQCGVAGVTRARIMGLAPMLGYDLEVRHLRLSELMDADEVIVCNSLYGAWQVRHLANHTWQQGVLAAKLRERLREDDTISA